MMTEPVDDAGAVLAAARAGCRESTGQALERFRRYLLTIANHQLDPELRAKGGASDLVQETFLEAQRDLQRFQGSSTEELRAWLRQILVHNVGAFSRRFRVAEMRAVAREVPMQADESLCGRDNGLAGSAPSPSSVAIEHEQARALRGAVERLREEYRQVVMLRFERGQSFEEIARETGRSPDAARHLWTRAMMQLRRDLEGRL